jgi:hypothetical protein
VTLAGGLHYAWVGANGAVQVFDIPPKHKFDPAVGQVVSVSDSDFDQYITIFNDMCSSVAGQPGRRIPRYDLTCGQTCSTDSD